MLLDQYQRRLKLSPGSSISIENLDMARRQSEMANANYQQAIASRDTAALNLKRTEVRASVNGFVTNLNLAKGTFASQGKPVMALIDSDSYRVEAYFEETKIPHIKPDAIAEIHLMDGSPALQGTVLGISRGITDQDNKDGPELLDRKSTRLNSSHLGSSYAVFCLKNNKQGHTPLRAEADVTARIAAFCSTC